MSSANDTDKSISPARSNSGIARRKRLDRFFAMLGLLCMLSALVVLASLLLQLALDGAGRLSWQFLTSYPSRFASQAGILTAWIGTTLVMFLTALTAVPLGVSAAIYLEEYAPTNWLTDIIEINIA